MKVGIVNDLPLAVEALRRAVALRPDYEVAWIAENGSKALEMCHRNPPQVVLMDLIMPVMDGVEATRRIMAECPCAILVVTVNVGTNAALVFEAMGHGALDAVDTPPLGAKDPATAAGPLLSKMATIERLIENRAVRVSAPRLGPGAPTNVRSAGLVAIGSSAGGPAALSLLLRQLPTDFSPGVVIVQHVDPQFAAGMADWLQLHTSLKVRLAVPGDVPCRGTVLIAGRADHLTMGENGALAYTPHPRECVFRPSVDVFFQSVAAHWNGPVVGVILTGMGRDGAAGLRMLRDRGYPTIAQDKASSAVYGMPKAAMEAGAATEILPLAEIPAALGRHFSTK